MSGLKINLKLPLRPGSDDAQKKNLPSSSTPNSSSTTARAKLKMIVQQPKPPVQTAKNPKNIKLKLSNPRKPALNRLRLKPTRIPGEGYDSEDSEIEDDPLMEEGLILRCLPDAELEYIRHAVETGELDDITIVWKDPKRALLRVRDVMYVAKLIHLPNVIEVMKSLDKKNVFKTIDIAQILLVVKRIQHEDELKDIPVYDDEIYESGITPPLAHITHSAFRRKIDNSEIEALEAKVDELIRLDEEAEETSYEMVDPESLQADPSHYDVPTLLTEPQLPQKPDEQEVLPDDFEMELEQALEEENLFGDEEEEDDGLNEPANEENDSSSDDDASDSENEAQRATEVDENEQHNALLRDEINELTATIEANKGRLAKTHNALMKGRVLDSIKKLEKELENKRRQLKSGEEKKNEGVRENNGSKDGNQGNEVESSRAVSASGVDDDDDEEEDDDDDDDDDDDEMDDLFG